MKNKIITCASVLAITSLGFAMEPDVEANYKLIPSERVEANITVDDLTGATVIDKYGEEIATIHDFDINLSSGKISTAYLEVGGIMGVGSQYVTLPFSELTYDKAKDRFTVKTTRSEFKAHIGQHEENMRSNKKAHEKADYNNAHDEDNQLVAMWNSVKTSLGVDEKELAEVEAEVRGDKLYLEGEVRNHELKQKLGEAFKSSTDMKVVNKIEVSK